MFFFLSVVLCLTASEGFGADRICAKSNDTYIISDENVLLDSSFYEKKEVKCNPGVFACYSLWKEIPGPNNSSSILIVNQGCWETSGPADCPSNECVSRPSRATGAHMFCCCSTQFCNINISKFEPEPVTTTTPSGLLVGERLENATASRDRLIVFFGAGIILTASLVILVTFLRRWSPLIDKEISQKSADRGEAGPREPSSALYSMANVTLSKIVGEGRYGTVWLGLAKGEQIAVKIFHYSHYFYNEKDIYTLPFMDHPSLLTYLGSDESRDKDGSIRLSLFLSYCPLGTLQEFLKSRPISLSTFCSLAVTTAAGLAHLHTEIHLQGKRKPCITHRDVNTRNILVKEDMTCCICDLGLAVKITGPHYYSLGEEMHAETKSINDVGTLRYMAPEVLEGAVNLRDCETSLKQIDVYALGLVLWEMAIRIIDFYPRPADVLPYMLPFEKEVGLHPSLEDMQMTVCRNKARIMFPPDWKNTRASKCIRETIEDCTDQDGEARLTALCVQERLAHIYRAIIDGGGMSPTYNQTNSNFSMTILNYNNNNISNHFGNNTDSELTGERDKTDGGASEGTVETIITHSPSESSPHLTLLAECLQPYQGRNPCLERNLLCDSSEEVCIIETSAKDSRGETQALIAQPPLLRTRPPPPVPYHQNSPFQPLKQTNSEQEGCRSGSVVSRFSVPLKKLLGGEGKLTVSPFEPPRPTSLTLFTEEEEARLRELSGRIGTPGDLPPAVRKKRGERAARLSLYDDRIMSNSTF